MQSTSGIRSKRKTVRRPIAGPWVGTALVAAATACSAVWAIGLHADSQTSVETRADADGSAFETESTPTMSQLIEQASSADAQARFQAIAALADLGEGASEAIPAISAALEDADPTVRIQAARALWDIAGDREMVLETLSQELAGENARARALAAYVLGTLGADGRPVVPALHAALEDIDAVVRVHAAEALLHVAGDDQEAITALIDTLQTENDEARYLAALTLGNAPSKYAQQVTAALEQAQHDVDASVREVAGMSLGMVQSTLEAADPGISVDAQQPSTGPLESENTSVKTDDTREPRSQHQRGTAAVRDSELDAASDSTGTKSTDWTEQVNSAAANSSHAAVKPHVVQLVEELFHDDPGVRKDAAANLGWLGSDALPALPALLDTLDDPHPIVRAYAARAVVEVDPNRLSVALETLDELLASTRPGIRPVAAYLLGSFGAQAAPIVPSLHQALLDREPLVRIQVAEAIVKIDPVDRRAVDALLDGLQSDDGRVRYLAAANLGQIDGGHHKHVTPQLLAALEDSDAWVRSAAIDSLAALTATAGSGVMVASTEMDAGSGSEQALATADEPQQPGVEVASIEWWQTPPSASRARERQPEADTDWADEPVAAADSAAVEHNPSIDENEDSATQTQDSESSSDTRIADSPDAQDESSEPAEVAAADSATNNQYLPDLPPLPVPLEELEENPASEQLADYQDSGDDAQQSSEVASHSTLQPPIGEDLESVLPHAVLNLDDEPQVERTAQLDPPESIDEFSVDSEADDEAEIPAGEAYANVRRIQPMHELGTDIAPRVDEEGEPDERFFPDDVAAETFGQVPPHIHVKGISRDWWMPAYCWQATGYCHRPLYFEEVNLERHGHEFPIIQPALSAAHFFGTVPLLPYLKAAEPQHCGECKYTLGHYRPGSYAPFRHHCIPFSVNGALVEGAVFTALAIFIN